MAQMVRVSRSRSDSSSLVEYVIQSALLPSIHPVSSGSAAPPRISDREPDMSPREGARLQL